MQRKRAKGGPVLNRNEAVESASPLSSAQIVPGTFHAFIAFNLKFTATRNTALAMCILNCIVAIHDHVNSAHVFVHSDCGKQ